MRPPPPPPSGDKKRGKCLPPPILFALSSQTPFRLPVPRIRNENGNPAHQTRLVMEDKKKKGFFPLIILCHLHRHKKKKCLLPSLSPPSRPKNARLNVNFT